MQEKENGEWKKKCVFHEILRVRLEQNIEEKTDEHDSHRNDADEDEDERELQNFFQDDRLGQ